MFTKSVQKLVLTMCLTFFVAAIAATEFPVYSQCDKVTDAEIVADIYAKIKADKTLLSQVSHVNVISLYAAVKFQGWADSQKSYDKIVAIGMNEACVRLVNPNEFLAAPPPLDSATRSAGGCSSGTKQCGDVCIPEGDMCNITVQTGYQPSIFRLDPRSGFAMSVPGAAVVQLFSSAG
jgi:hypothetical protein